jgi:putative Mn2+ efflux pump MntP
MIPLAIATSIDALAVGVTFAFLSVNIIKAIVIIGCTTLVISMIGVKIGHIFGLKYKKNAEIVGGVILVLMGIKILLEHIGIL